MFNKILIANRGEIACRIIRTAKYLGIKTVAVYSTVDENALHTTLADEAFFIGSAPAADSYLCAEKIIAVAKKTNAKAIHPGYGFLSENADFAERCFQNNIIFIGPSADNIRAMGSKSEAKKRMENAGVPVIPGYHDDEQSIATLQKAAENIGYPVLLKPSAGGGGKGMRIVWQPQEFISALESAKREALTSFGDDHILIEKYLENPRHIEIQLFGDHYGNYVYLFERDCSVQRRHQKIIEEAPAPDITRDLRQRMGEAAIAAARAIGYIGAGTIEFLLHNDKFYFMEMNTRLQVEHPVTEMITGIDLVEWQFRIAMQEKLPLRQTQLQINGHAFEARIYAEDTNNDFLPSTGKLHYLNTPEENKYTRIDSGIVQGDNITHYYDPMIAKLITWDNTREEALKRLQQALNDFQIVGLKTNLELLAAIAQQKEFNDGKFNTGFIAEYHQQLTSEKPDSNKLLALVAVDVIEKQKIAAQQQARLSNDPYSPWHATDHWRLNLPAKQTLQFLIGKNNSLINIEHTPTHYQVTVDDINFTVSHVLTTENQISALVNHKKMHAIVISMENSLSVFGMGQRHLITLLTNNDYQDKKIFIAEDKSELTSPMPGKIIALLAKVNQHVATGDGLVIIEAMKMEHTVYAPARGIIKEWYFQEGDLVSEGMKLLAFEEI